MLDVKEIEKMTVEDMTEAIRKPVKVIGKDFITNISVEESLTIMQKGFLEILYDIESDLVRGISDPKFNEKARQTVRRTINEINADIDEKRRLKMERG